MVLPKETWIGVNHDNHTTCKIKGSKSKLTSLDFINLLSADNSININHVKWFRDFNSSTILMRDTPYVLKSTENKRINVICNGVLCGTKNILYTSP